jgi:hypothetical protein
MKPKRVAQGGLLVLAVACVLVTQVRAQTAAEGQDANDELQMGASIYQGYKAKRQIVESSPLFDLLEPIGREIVRVAQPRYEHPIRIPKPWLRSR